MGMAAILDMYPRPCGHIVAPMDVPHEIWLRLASWGLKEMIEMVEI